MQAIEVQLPRYGDHFKLVSRAWIRDNTVTGQLDFPPYAHLDFAHHFPGKPLLPGVKKLSLMFQAIKAFCAEATGGKLFPVLTGIPLVRFFNLTKPGGVEIQANVFQDGIGGVATCTVNAHGKERASAIFTFAMNAEEPPEIILPLPMEQIDIKVAQGSIRGVFNYQGDEILPLDHLEAIPFTLVLEALGQNAVQASCSDASLANALFIVTYLRGTVFHGTAPRGTLDLHTEVAWTEKRGLVHAAASYGGQPIVSGDFGFVILNPKRA